MPMNKAYKSTNKQSTSQKPLIVLIHGLRGDHHGLSELAKYLSKDFEVLNPDLPGTGKNPAPKQGSLETHIKWLHQYCSALPRKPYILGHSMGSIIVSHFVARYPDDVEDKIILLAPIFRTKISAKLNRLGYYALNGVLKPIPRKPKRRFLASRPISFCISHYLTYDKTQQKHIDQLHYLYAGNFASADSLMSDVKVSMLQTTIFPGNKQVLVCAGAHDRLSPAKLARQTSAQIHNVTYLELESTGHLMNYEQPAAVAECVTRFILPYTSSSKSSIKSDHIKSTKSARSAKTIKPAKPTQPQS